ncbi:348_t:CDS:2 [Acaulospora colombiana]|uniref:348_t:CDS:1 n=1 Tax=Acaulospora colombiana TaxID=27376 RepID=A0ACA9MUV7_9GLOM|nr:348_t:CDS:2 [Acaulospora colombiana]
MRASYRGLNQPLQTRALQALTNPSLPTTLPPIVARDIVSYTAKSQYSWMKPVRTGRCIVVEPMSSSIEITGDEPEMPSPKLSSYEVEGRNHPVGEETSDELSD